MIKRRSADRSEWQRVIERRFAHIEIESDLFTGTIALLCIDAMTEPLWIKTETQDFCVADAGYSWLQHFPTGENYGVTTMFDERGQIIQWYIDIMKQHSVDERGVPWWDDLYLDIVVMPDGTSAILDEDELDEALEDGAISQEEHRLAWDVTNRLKAQLDQRQFPLFELCVEHRQLLLSRLD